MTAKEQRFCDEYLIDMNITRAAIRAGYAESTAKNAAYWINKEADERQVKAGRKSQYKPEVVKCIQEKTNQMHNEKTADVQEIWEYLSSVMRGEHKEQTLRMAGDGVQEITEIDVSEKDRLKAAELMGKGYGMFKDNVNMSMDPVMIVSDLKE